MMSVFEFLVLLLLAVDLGFRVSTWKKELNALKQIKTGLDHVRSGIEALSQGQSNIYSKAANGEARISLVQERLEAIGGFLSEKLSAVLTKKKTKR